MTQSTAEFKVFKMMTVYKNHKYKLVTTRRNHEQLEMLLHLQRELYNAALQERVECYKKTGKTINYYDQSDSLTILRKSVPEYKKCPVSVSRWTLYQLEKSFNLFFRSGGGYPRFKSVNRYRSIGFKQMDGIIVKDDKVKIKGLSDIKLNLHQPIPDEIKSCVITRNAKGWFITFACKITQTEKPTRNGTAVGIDLGITHLATLSTGETIENPKHFKKTERKIKDLQKRLARCKKGSNNRKRIKTRLAKQHLRIVNQRNDYLHKISKDLTNGYTSIMVEDLEIDRMKRSRFAKSIGECSWATFRRYLTYKAESAGGQVVKVDPRNTTKNCFGCQWPVEKTIQDRTHFCPLCGTTLDRDHNAAINILNKGGAVLGSQTAKA